MPQIPIVAPNEVGPNQDVAPLNPLAPAFVPQQPIISKEEKLALANASRKKQLRQADLTEALTFMRSLPSNDAIDLDAPELKKHNFSEDEFDTLLLLFTANPLPEDTGEQTLRFMEGIETLSERITPADAIRFKSWSDKFKDKKVALSLCMDDNAKYLINLEIDRNKERLGLSDDAARTWFSRWTHNQLAKYVIKLWSGSSHTQNDTIDNAYQKFKIDVNSSQLDINNVSGEQHLITSLHKVRETYGTSESDLPENQLRYVKMLKDKIGKQSPYTLDMNACFSDHKKWPSKTVSDWINCFAHIRANVR
jgi:hypothetical protein